MSSPDNDIVKWYVMRAYKRERKAVLALADEGVETFYPLHKVIMEKGGTKKLVEKPLITSYIFVRSSRKLLLELKKIYPFLQFVMVNMDSLSREMTIPDSSMDDFICLVRSEYPRLKFYYYGEETYARILKGTRVKVIEGAFAGHEARVLSVKGSRNREVAVVIDGLVAATVQMRAESLQILNK